jgi:hypothetical protein
MRGASKVDRVGARRGAVKPYHFLDLVDACWSVSTAKLNVSKAKLLSQVTLQNFSIFISHSCDNQLNLVWNM